MLDNPTRLFLIWLNIMVVVVWIVLLLDKPNLDKSEPSTLPPIATDTLTPEPRPPGGETGKDLVICMSEEPGALYPYNGGSLAQTIIEHNIYEDIFTRPFHYSDTVPDSETLSSRDGVTIVINRVWVSAGDEIVKANDDVGDLAVGDTVINWNREEIVYEGSNIEMPQIEFYFSTEQMVWQDGEPVTVEDFIFGYEIAEELDISDYLIERTFEYEKTGDDTLRWIMMPGFLDMAFDDIWQPLPTHVWDDSSAADLIELEDFRRRPLANGPFRIAEWVEGEEIRLVRNENYFRGDALPKLDSVTFRFDPDGYSLLVRLLVGECDIVTDDGLDVSHWSFLVDTEAQGLLTPYFQMGETFEYIAFSIYDESGLTRPGRFTDNRVRRAMTLCTNRQSMVDTILYGEGEIMYTYIPPDYSLYPDGLEIWSYDVERANGLLDDVGWTDTDGDGIRNLDDRRSFIVTLGFDQENERHRQIAEIFQENMRDCGIEVNLPQFSAEDWLADGSLLEKGVDIGIFTSPIDLVPNCHRYSQSGFANGDFDENCEAASHYLLGESKYTEYHQAALGDWVDSMPIIPLFADLKVSVTRPGICNVGVDPILTNLAEISVNDCE